MADSPLTYPNRDLRGMYTWLREKIARLEARKDQAQSPDLAQLKSAQSAIVDKLQTQLKSARSVALGGENRQQPPVMDRPLDYPFTKGISVINDGIAYGEIIADRRVHAGQSTVDGDFPARRTKTGRVEFWPKTTR